MAAYLDFQEIKARVPIDRVVTMLGIAMKRSGPQLRAACPMCRSGGDRALAVTIERSSYYCFAEKKGGDQIALAAHVLGIPPREAAAKIAEHFGIESTAPSTAPSPRPATEKATSLGKEMQPLEDLDPLHEAVEALGISPATADALGIGYRERGTLKAGVHIPLRSRSGELVGYMRVNLDDAEPFKFPSNLEERATNVVPLKRA